VQLLHTLYGDALHSAKASIQQTQAVGSVTNSIRGAVVLGGRGGKRLVGTLRVATAYTALVRARNRAAAFGGLFLEGSSVCSSISLSLLSPLPHLDARTGNGSIVATKFKLFRK
jgi:hypothetical protein